jgi:molybdopterin-binding protein
MKLSARNIVPGKVTEITRGEAIANVVMDCNGQRLVSSITVAKASDVMIGIAPV